MGALRPGPAHAGGLGEHGGDRGGEEGETGDHGQVERTSSDIRSAHFENAVTRSVPCERSDGRIGTASSEPETRRATGGRHCTTPDPRGDGRPPAALLPGAARGRPSTRSATISSERLAELAGVNAAKVRKDLSYLGSYGTRGVGYDVEYLLHEISRELGLTRDWPVAIVGIGNLGRALANYRGFGARGFRIVALVDADPDLVGKRGRRPRRSSPSTTLDRIVAERKIAIGIIATPAPRRPGGRRPPRRRRRRARSSTSRPRCCTVPDGVSMRKVDLAIELQILSFYQLRRGAASGRAGRLSRAGRSPGAAGLPGEPARARPAGRRGRRRADRGPQDRAAPRPRRRGRGGRARGRRRGPGVGRRRAAARCASARSRPPISTAPGSRSPRPTIPPSTPRCYAAGEARPGLGQQRRRPGQLLLYADVGGPPGRPRRRGRHRRPQSGARRPPATAA